MVPEINDDDMSDESDSDLPPPPTGQPVAPPTELEPIDDGDDDDGDDDDSEAPPTAQQVSEVGTVLSYRCYECGDPCKTVASLSDGRKVAVCSHQCLPKVLAELER